MRPQRLDTTHDAAKLTSSLAWEPLNVATATLEAGGIVGPGLRAARLADLATSHPLTEDERRRLADLMERRRALETTKGKKGRAGE